MQHNQVNNNKNTIKFNNNDTNQSNNQLNESNNQSNKDTINQICNFSFIKRILMLTLT
jgi:hypothetical protein